MAQDPLAEKAIMQAAIKAKQQQQAAAAGRPAHRAVPVSAASRYAALAIWVLAVASIAAMVWASKG